MAGRQSRGRQKIPLRLIANQDDLYATFSKRRLGLYKKASELCTLCGVDIGIIIFSPTNNPFSFFHPTMESVIRRHRNPNHQMSDFTRLVEGHTRGKIENLNRRLDEVLDQRDQVKEREKVLDEAAKTREKGWWETPVESLNKEQVKGWTTWFENLKALVSSRTEQLKNEHSSSTAFQLPNDTGVVDALIDTCVPYESSGAPTDLTHYYGADQQAHNPLLGGGTGDASPIHYYFTPSGGAGDAGQNLVFPPSAYNPFAGEAGPSHCFAHPPPAHNIFATGGSGEAGPSQHFAHPPPAHNIFATSGVGEAGPSQRFGPPPPSHYPFTSSELGEIDPSQFFIPRPSRGLFIGSSRHDEQGGPSQYFVASNTSIGEGPSTNEELLDPSHQVDKNT